MAVTSENTATHPPAMMLSSGTKMFTSQIDTGAGSDALPIAVLTFPFPNTKVPPTTYPGGQVPVDISVSDPEGQDSNWIHQLSGMAQEISIEDSAPPTDH